MLVYFSYLLLNTVISNIERQKVPGSESSTLWNFRSWERNFFGTKVPATPSYKCTSLK